MYFYQTLNQFGPSAVGFLVWEMSSPVVKREEQGEAAPREQWGAGLRAPLLWNGDTAQELSVEGGGWGVLHLSVGVWAVGDSSLLSWCQMAEQRWEGDVGWVCGVHLGDCTGWTLLCSKEVKIPAEE